MSNYNSTIWRRFSILSRRGSHSFVKNFQLQIWDRGRKVTSLMSVWMYLWLEDNWVILRSPFLQGGILIEFITRYASSHLVMYHLNHLNITQLSWRQPSYVQMGTHLNITGFASSKLSYVEIPFSTFTSSHRPGLDGFVPWPIYN